MRGINMKCIVVYYSQTGNTEKIAKKIQLGVNQVTGHCDIVKIIDANPRSLYKYDLIGLGAPVGFQFTIVRVFINDMRFVGGKHIFAFCTHGGSPDLFFPTIVPDLKRRGLIVIGTRDWYGDCTLLHHIEPYPTAGHPDEIDLMEAERFGSEMAEHSRRIYAGETGLIPPLPKASRPISKKESSGKDVLLQFSSMVKFHKEKCLYPKCRLCMDNCPAYGIDLTVEPPVIAKPCYYCEWCARICPSGAIDILDWLKDMSESPGGDASLMKEVVMPKLAQAEAEGRFRRLLPVEEITYTHRYKLHTKHPYWVIGKGPR
jgi:ferredoxin